MRIDHNIDLAGEARRQSIEFHGTGGGYFRIWIINILCTVLTLGIFSAWAKVRTRQYFYRNTLFDGSAFDYHGSPLAILKTRVFVLVSIALLAGAGYLSFYLRIAGPVIIALLLPWLLWRTLKYEADMSSYRSIRFGFKGNPLHLYFIFLLMPCVVILCGMGVGYMIVFSKLPNLLAASGYAKWLQPVAIGVALSSYWSVPYFQQKWRYYIYNQHQLGNARFKARLESPFFYGVYLKASILAGLMGTLLLGMSTVISFSFERGQWLTQLKAAPYLAAVVGVLLIMTVVFIAWSTTFISVRYRNYSLRRLQLQSAVTFQSEMLVSRMFGIRMTNLLLILLTLGLAWPWARVRSYHYRLRTIGARLYGDTDSYLDQLSTRQSTQDVPMREEFDPGLDLRI